MANVSMSTVNDGPIIQDFRVRNQLTTIKNTRIAGGSTTYLPSSGNLDLQVSSAGVSPGATATDKILAITTIPANFFNLAGKTVIVTAAGSFAATANNKLVKLVIGATTPTVGSTLSGGTTIATTGTVATNGAGWQIEAAVVKYGAAGSNTQLTIHGQSQCGSAVQSLAAPSALTQTESGAITICVVGNASTATTDIVFNFLESFATN